ncbi:MAG: hypothetical protein ACOX4N_07220 [Dethiobacteraceae bacterium]|jgi:hypothetical protein|nr:hypothetical protein [Bacillota bacterium]
MRIRTILLFLLILLLPGCGAVRGFESTADKYESSDQIISLADVDFTIVPDFTYHILLEEKMSAERTKFIRRYVRYDGINDTIAEAQQEAVLPERCQDVNEAKVWLQEHEPEKLVVFPQTFLSDSVQAQWEEAGYDYHIEEAHLISLEGLKKMGAVSRLNEVFVIDEQPEEMVALIEAVEADYLKPAANLQIERELEALPRAFSYHLQLRTFSDPLTEPADLCSTAKIDLLYQIDELGNPLELNFAVSFEDHTQQGSETWLPEARQAGTFTIEMRNALVSQLDLFGVTPANPALAYANVTLKYDGSAEKNRLAERIYIP